MKQGKRHIIQGIVALAYNANLPSFANGTIWQGASKKVCVPGLNCYSCPGALGSCPIGSLQAILGGGRRGVSFYVVGLMLFFGALLGRLICGFLCPFGLVQDLLHKIKTPKLRIPKKADKYMRYIKYGILAVFVILMPLLLKNDFGIGTPYFCKLICPAGTLEGGIPLVLANEGLRSIVGFLFSWKMGLLILTIAASILIYRPFCKYICPLGAFYGLFNRFSLYSMNVEKSTCTSCGACTHACKMGVDVLKNINSTECIRCGACKQVCPTGSISSGFRRTKKEKAASSLNNI